MDRSKSPATTVSDLNGTWNLLYSTAECLPAGVFGPFVGEVQQKLDLKKRKHMCLVSFLFGLFRFEWDSGYNVRGNDRWDLPNEDWVPILFGLRFSIISFSNDYTVDWKMSYTDPDLRIVRTEGDTKRGPSRHVYVLQREG